jgi:hypothetical protein
MADKPANYKHVSWIDREDADVPQKRSVCVPLRNNPIRVRKFYNNPFARLEMQCRELVGFGSPWAFELRAISIEVPGRLLQFLTGAILGCGG